MKVQINPEAKIQEIVEIAYKMRYRQKIWKEHYGAVNRKNAKEWEDKMDRWLQDNVDNFNKILT